MVLSYKLQEKNLDQKYTEIKVTHYKTEKAGVKDQLIARADNDIILVSTPIRR